MTDRNRALEEAAKVADGLPGWKQPRDVAAAIRALITTPSTLPADVVRLVIAARIVAFEDQGPEAMKELDKASEAFAERVPWDDEPSLIGDANLSASAEELIAQALPLKLPATTGDGDALETEGGEVERKLCRPIIGIESRTAQEVFDIMADRVRSHLKGTRNGQ